MRRLSTLDVLDFLLDKFVTMGLIPIKNDGVHYESYLKVNELLKLQHPLSMPPHHDEMLFIVIHQAYELWFKLLLHEGEQAFTQLEQGQSYLANHFLKRMVEILKLLVDQIHILETMAPIDFLEFRDRLNPASGFQSVQFRQLEFLAGLKNPMYLDFFKDQPTSVERLGNYLEKPDLNDAFKSFMKKNDLKFPDDLKTIYENPNRFPGVYQVCESLLDFDEYFGFFREHHVRVVERMIGSKTGTGGSTGVEYLQKTTSKRFFPYLWDVRSHIAKQELS